MSGWQRLAMGFALGGVLMLFLHPGSRTVMTYSLQSDRVAPILNADPIVKEPLEMFPPLRPAEMTANERFLVAYRIARRLNQPSVNATAADLRAALGFVEQCSQLDSDNAYWKQFEAGLEMRAGNSKLAAESWDLAHKKTSWSTGVSSLTDDLWDKVANAEGVRFAWQGLCVGSYPDDSPVAFIEGQLRKQDSNEVPLRFATVANADTILRDVHTFADGRRAAALANTATFGSDLPLRSHSRPEIEQIRSSFAMEVGMSLGNAEASRARRAMRSVETWESFVQPGEAQRDRVLDRLRLESRITSTLPSALLVSTLVMAAVALLGKILYQLFENVPHPDSRLLIALAVTLGGFLFIKTGVLLLAMWVVVLGLLVGLPIPIGRPEPLPIGVVSGFVMRAVAFISISSLTTWFVLAATPSKHLAGVQLEGLFLGVAVGAISLLFPIGALLARINERGILPAIGDSLFAAGSFAAIFGLFATIVTTPICLYRDVQNRNLVQQWITSERDLFRMDTE